MHASHDSNFLPFCACSHLGMPSKAPLWGMKWLLAIRQFTNTGSASNDGQLYNRVLIYVNYNSRHSIYDSLNYSVKCRNCCSIQLFPFAFTNLPQVTIPIFGLFILFCPFASLLTFTAKLPLFLTLTRVHSCSLWTPPCMHTLGKNSSADYLTSLSEDLVLESSAPLQLFYLFTFCF